MLFLQSSTVFYLSIVVIIVTGDINLSADITHPVLNTAINQPLRLTGSITLEDADTVLSRLKQISYRTSSRLSKLLQVQEEEFKVNSVYKTGWNNAVNVYDAKKKTELSKITDVDKEYHIALIAYTMRGQFFDNFSTETRNLRTDSDIDNYKWKSYFKLLQLAVEQLGAGVERWKPSNFNVLYRGAKSRFSLKVNTTIAFQQFTSSSTSLDIAKNYSKGVTLFEFRDIHKTIAMSLMDHSVFPEEKEILFSPSQTFRVIAIHAGSPERFILSSSILIYGNYFLVMMMGLFVSVATIG